MNNNDLKLLSEAYEKIYESNATLGPVEGITQIFGQDKSVPDNILIKVENLYRQAMFKYAKENGLSLEEAVYYWADRVQDMNYTPEDFNSIYLTATLYDFLEPENIVKLTVRDAYLDIKQNMNDVI